jgi:hypothetical protein
MNKTHITFGKNLKVFRIGLGTNRIHDDEKSQKALKKAFELGINFIDTASAYTGGVSEETIGKTLAPYNGVVIATKGGMSAPDFHIDSNPETLEKQLNASLDKLKLKTIPLYFLHRIDPNVPLKESLMFLTLAYHKFQLMRLKKQENMLKLLLLKMNTIFPVAGMKMLLNMQKKKILFLFLSSRYILVIFTYRFYRVSRKNIMRHHLNSRLPGFLNAQNKCFQFPVRYQLSILKKLLLQ